MKSVLINVSLHLTKFALLTGILVGALTVSYLQAAWDEPTAHPTGGNVAPPIHAGPDEQTKEGNLNLKNRWPSLGLVDTDSQSWWVRSGGDNFDVLADRNGNNTQEAADWPSILSLWRDQFGSGMRVSGDQILSDSSPTIEFADNDQGVHPDWWTHVNGGNMYFMRDDNDDDNWANDGNYSLVMGQGVNAPYPDYAQFANQVRAEEYCDRNGGNCFESSKVSSVTGTFDLSDIYYVNEDSALGIWSDIPECDNNDLQLGTMWCSRDIKNLNHERICMTATVVCLDVNDPNWPGRTGGHMKNWTDPYGPERSYLK